MSKRAVSACTILADNSRVCVERDKRANPKRRKLLAEAVSYDSGAHGAPVNPKAMEKLSRAMRSGKVEAWYPIFKGKGAGASIEYPSVYTVWDGKQFVHFAAIYGEDRSVFADFSKAFRESTKTPENLKGKGFGTWLEEQCILHWVLNADKEAPYGMVPAVLLGEIRLKGTAAVTMFGKLGGRIGAEQVIKEVDGRQVKPAWDVEPKPGEFFSPDGKPLNHIFPVIWSSADGKQQLCATFTEGISSFTGETIIRVQFASNGSLPEKAVLKDVLASMLKAGQTEIDDNPNRQWGLNNPNNPSPVISIGGSKLEMQISAFGVAGDEVAQRRGQPGRAPASIMRIHTFDDAILAALPGHDRVLGDHIMHPMDLSLTEAAEKLSGVAVPKAKPLGLILH